MLLDVFHCGKESVHKLWHIDESKGESTVIINKILQHDNLI